MPTGMSDEFTSFDQRAIIKVCGVGGGGNNAVNRMISEGLDGVEFIAVNTDAQALKNSPAGTRLQIGVEMTGGLGSGAVPETGRQAAEEDRERIHQLLDGADMIFLTAGLGGGTGTGACPVIAEVAREIGALTVAIVTLPFAFEGPRRMDNAQAGLKALEPHVDTLIVVPNERVATLYQNNVTFLDAFHRADEVLHNGVRAITELITVPGLINLDFADVRTIMQARGRALMGIGRATGESRAQEAAGESIVCPLLEQSNITGARGVVVNIRGGSDITMQEVQRAVQCVQSSAHPEANIIFGAVVDDDPSEELQVTVIAAGFPSESVQQDPNSIPVDIRQHIAPAPVKPDEAPAAARVPGNGHPAPKSMPEQAPQPEPVKPSARPAARRAAAESQPKPVAAPAEWDEAFNGGGAHNPAAYREAAGEPEKAGQDPQGSEAADAELELFPSSNAPEESPEERTRREMEKDLHIPAFMRNKLNKRKWG